MLTQNPSPIASRGQAKNTEVVLADIVVCSARKEVGEGVKKRRGLGKVESAE